MKRTIPILTVLLILAAVLPAQDYKGKGRIVGTVLDQDGKPLEGVRVKLVFVRSAAGFTVTSDKDGRWVGAWLRGGAWNVDFDKIGYQPVKKSVEVSEVAKNPELSATMVKIAGLAMSDELKDELTKANALFEQKNITGALDAYQAIMVKYPDAYPLWKNVGNCYFALEQYDKAEEQYLKILAKDPRNADAMVLIGNTYANRNLADQALEWYGKVSFDLIKDSTVLYNIGTNYYNMGKFEDALRCFQKAAQVEPGNLDALYQLGLTQLNLQKNTEAVAAFELYLKQDPDSERAAQVRSFLEYLRKK
jgi:Flp pilus assembly protein TadD